MPDDKQLSFDFMSEPEQLSPKAEYRAYLRSIRDEKPQATNMEEESYGSPKAQKRKNVHARS